MSPLSAAEKRRFEAEIVPHLDLLYRMARSVCCDLDRAEDVAHESFLKALRGFGGLEPDSNARGWLARIVHNTCRDAWRKQARQGEVDWDDDFEAIAIEPVREGEWEPAVVRDAFDDEIEAALAALPPRWRSAVLLVDVEGWSYDEAAASLGIAAGSLRSALHRARKVLYGSLRDAARQRNLRQGESAS